MNHSEATTARRLPVFTCLMMAAAVLSALALLDWTGSGEPRPLWAFFAPLGLGLVGTVFGIRARRPGWAIASGLLGVAVVPVLIVVVTLTSGP